MLTTNKLCGATENDVAWAAGVILSADDFESTVTDRLRNELRQLAELRARQLQGVKALEERHQPFVDVLYAQFLVTPVVSGLTAEECEFHSHMGDVSASEARNMFSGV